MSTWLKVVLIVLGCMLVLGTVFIIAIFVAINKTANAQEYKLGADTLKSINAIVGKRKVTNTSVSLRNGITTKEVDYRSDRVQDDLLAYSQYLRGEGGFALTKNMNLNIIPSTIELAKKSNEEGNVILMAIDYNTSGYKVKIQKGQGGLSLK